MRCRIAVTAKEQVGFESFALPPLEPHQMLIETLYSAISPDTEPAFIQHRPNTSGRCPYYPGYSACGRVIDKGGAVDFLGVGQLVAWQLLLTASGSGL